MASIMMPQAGLSIGSPIADGRVTVRGFARDWKVDKNWWLQGAEYIEPLNAIGPTALLCPAAMLSSAWTKASGYNDAWRIAHVEGSWGTDFFEYGDCGLYELGVNTAYEFTGGLVSTLEYAPRLLMSFVRFPATPGQRVPVTITVQMLCQYYDGAAWQDGQACFTFPVVGSDADAAGAPSPFLAAIEGTGFTWDPLTEGNCLLKFGQSSALSQKEKYEQWVLEYEEDPELYQGGHVLIRNVENMEQYYHFYHKNFRLVGGNITVTCAGAVSYVNITPLLYGQYACAVGPAYQSQVALPSATTHTWEDTADFGVIASDVSGWAGAITNNVLIDAGQYLPTVTFTKTSNPFQRPILWYSYQDNAATVAGAVSGMTPVTGLVTSMTYTLRNNWRGASGSANIAVTGNEELTSWLPGSKLEVTMGQQTGDDAELAADVIATAYITPDGIKRRITGEYLGAPQVSVEFADLTQARISRTCIVDMRQAGGQTVAEWAANCAARLGIPSTMLDVATAVGSLVIPLGELPSSPAFAAEDGDSFCEHFDAVCNSLDIRWGVDKDADGKLFFDAGKPEYVDGASVIAYTINETTMTPADIIDAVEVITEYSKQKNSIKAVSADAEEKAFYVMQDDAVISASEGHDFFAVVKGEKFQTVENLAQAAYNELASLNNMQLQWSGPIRRSLRPDMFVKVESLTGLGVTAGSVFQITENVLTCGPGSEHSSKITMALCFVPEEVPS